MVVRTWLKRRKGKNVVRPVKIFKGESPVEEIQQAFRDEMADIAKNASLRLKCPIEQLKYRFDNLGRVEVQKMTRTEMADKRKEATERERVAIIRSRRNNG